MATADQRTDFGEALKAARKTAGLSLRRLAEIIGASHTNVLDWENGKHAPRAETVPALEEALGVPKGSLARRLGYLADGGDEAPPASSVMEAIEADPRLGQRDRAILGAVYRVLVRSRPDGTQTASNGATSGNSP